jgi:hypothetical protein
MLSTQQSVKIMLMGEGDCGKGTLCKFVAVKYGMSAKSSSEHACEIFMFDQLKDKYGYKSPKECHADRRNHRKEWYEGIYAFNKVKLTALGEDLYSKYDIYDGVRHKDEFTAMKDAGLFDISIWIDSSERVDGESQESISVTKDMADIIILNNGSEEEYIAKIEALFSVLMFNRD